MTKLIAIVKVPSMSPDACCEHKIPRLLGRLVWRFAALIELLAAGDSPHGVPGLMEVEIHGVNGNNTAERPGVPSFFGVSPAGGNTDAVAVEAISQLSTFNFCTQMFSDTSYGHPQRSSQFLSILSILSVFSGSRSTAFGESPRD